MQAYHANLENFADQTSMLIFSHKILTNLFVWVLFVGKSTTIVVAEAPENTDLCELSQGLPFWHQDLALPNSQSWDVSGQTTSRIGTQTQPTEDRVPEAVLTSQPPINARCDTTLPTCGTRPSLTHRWAGASPSYQGISTSPMTSITHWKQTPEERGAMIL